MSRYPLAPGPLSDGLVGLVLPRTHAGRHHEDVAMPFHATVSPYDSSFLHSSRDEYRAAGEASDALLSLTDGRGGNTPPRVSIKLEEMSPKETHRHRRAEANKIRRREQCRANQARYRDKQRNAQMQLETSVEHLHAELDKLKRRYRDLSSRERNNQSPWSIVADVFRLLESSFRSPWADAREMQKHTETRQILAVLERAFAHDTAMGELRGVDALMEQLRLFSQSFGSPILKLQRVEMVAPGVMTATAKLSVIVTEFTLEHVFPHLTDDLYQRLLGQRLDCSTSMTFLFDGDSDRVVRLETSIDIVSSLLRVLGSISDVSDVLQHSRMTAESTISGSTDRCILIVRFSSNYPVYSFLMSVSRHFTASFEHFEPCQTQVGDEIVGFVFPRVPQARHTNLSQERSLLVNSRSSGVPDIITNTESHQAESIIETISNELLQTDKTITRKRKGIDRREQCRINQVRYRKRQRLILLQLEESVKRLRKEVAYLKRVVRPELKCKHSPWAIVAEVVRQVNDYLSLWRKVGVATTTNDIKLQTFLEECFSPVVTMGDTTGVDALIEQLQHYAPNFGDPKLQLQRIESKVPGVMMATGRFQMTVTELSLCKVFLNLPLGSRIGRDGRHATLHERLLGQRLSCSCTITFLFDDNGRVDRLEVNLDLVNPLLQVFEKLEDVANTLMNCS